MSIAAQSSVRPAASATPNEKSWFASNWGLLAAIVALVAILLLPTPAGLPVAGHRMLAILAFALVIWMMEAVDYAVSAILIAALTAFLLDLAPNVANPKVLLGTSGALTLAFSGFANTALVLVAAALFLAAAMTATGLDKRIALSILSRVGIETAAAQNMVAYGTDTFHARDFVRTGLVLTPIAIALVMVLGATYWRWLGYV